MKSQKGTGDYMELYHDLRDRVLKGQGQSSQEQRLAAFNNDGLPQWLSALIEKVAHKAYKITDKEIYDAKQTGITEDQLFELIICAAIGQSSRQYESGLNALEEAKKKGGAHAS